MMRYLKFSMLTVAMLFLLLIFLILDFSPQVPYSAHRQVENADEVHDLIKQLRASLRGRYTRQQIDISIGQADSLLGFVQRALPEVSSQLSLSDTSIELDISYQLPSFFLGSYINLTLQILEGDALAIEYVKVGSITVPGDWLLGLAESLVNTYTKSVVATSAIQQIEKIDVNPDQVSVYLHPLDTLLRELKNIRTSSGGEDNQLLRIKTAHYLRFLGDLRASDGTKQGTSLSYYLQALMVEAKSMTSSGLGDQENSATLENEAAIFALAIFAGNRRFAAVIGDMSFAIDKIPTSPYSPTLASRKDLSLHFIFSAAIKLMSEQGISIAVGEFKELMDRGEGGSGYSFVDLSADMAGANFAALAVDPRTARQIQNIVSLESAEMLFFPSIDNLEEGMGKTEFKTKYTDVESDEYKKVVNEINRRLDILPIGRRAFN
jgi:hypothetical protein